MLSLPGKSYAGEIPSLTTEQVDSKNRMQAHVEMLAGQIGERNIWNEAALEKSAKYIEKIFSDQGFDVLLHEIESLGTIVRNIEVEIKGVDKPDEIIIVGAHYDSVEGSPGANDNGTGVAAVLELARLFKDSKPKRTIRFVAFVNEEPPFFLSSEMGSQYYAKRSRERGENIVAMYSIETIGHYDDKAWSQRYPFPFMFFYPIRANFIGFVSNIGSRELMLQSLRLFRKNARFPSEGVYAPGWLTGIGWSDHRSFWQSGYKGVMITDTALFRYPYYHSALDTPDKVDYTRMTQVVWGVRAMLTELQASPISK